MKEIGKVVHFFDKISVAIIELTAGLKIGDTVTFKGKEEFDQEVTSMQIDHKEIEEAKAGDAIGVKTDKPVHEGVKVEKK
jgi:U32 family peptidase